jgi:hypothetical protein
VHVSFGDFGEIVSEGVSDEDWFGYNITIPRLTVSAHSVYPTRMRRQSSRSFLNTKIVLFSMKSN